MFGSYIGNKNPLQRDQATITGREFVVVLQDQPDELFAVEDCIADFLEAKASFDVVTLNVVNASSIKQR